MARTTQPGKPRIGAAACADGGRLPAEFFFARRVLADGEVSHVEGKPVGQYAMSPIWQVLESFGLRDEIEAMKIADFDADECGKPSRCLLSLFHAIGEQHDAQVGMSCDVECAVRGSRLTEKAE